METKRLATQIEPPSESSALADDAWAYVSLLPCMLSVEIEAPHFTIGDLLDLEVGCVINSHHPRSGPVPLWVNGVKLCWAEFDVIGKRLGIRLTGPE